MDLDGLLSPLAVEQFLEQHWAKRALHLRGPEDKFERLGMDHDAFMSAVARCADEFYTDSRRFKACYPQPGASHVEIMAHPSQARHLLAAGMTLVLANVHLHDERLAELAGRLQIGLGTTHVRANVFLSPPGSGLSLHFDCDHTLLLQLSGSKHWRVSPGADVPSPTVNALAGEDAASKGLDWSLEIVSPDESTLSSYDMMQGDVLYMPPGTWHRGVAGEHGSLHVTLAVAPVSARLLFEDLLRERTEKQREWRQHVPLARDGEALVAGRLPETLRAFFAQRLHELRELINGLTPEDLARSWVQHLHQLEWSPSFMAGAEELQPTDRLCVRRELRPMLLDTPREAESFELYVAGHRLRLSGVLRPALSRMWERPHFTGEEVLRWLGAGQSWGAVRPALQELVSIGALHRLEHEPLGEQAQAVRPGS